MSEQESIWHSTMDETDEKLIRLIQDGLRRRTGNFRRRSRRPFAKTDGSEKNSPIRRIYRPYRIGFYGQRHGCLARSERENGRNRKKNGFF